MSKNTDNKDLDQSNDKSLSNDSKKALIKETQGQRAKENQPENVESFGHAFNKLVATATGSRIESVADSLSPEIVVRLYRGKMLEQDTQTHKAGPLSADDRQSLNDYRKFKDTISRQIPLFDHDALMDTLNARIAERVLQQTSTIEPIARDSKLTTTSTNVVKTSTAIDHTRDISGPLIVHKIQQTEKQIAKIDAPVSVDRKQTQASDRAEKGSPVSGATVVDHSARQREIKSSEKLPSEKDRTRPSLTAVAGKPSFENFRGQMRPDETRLSAQKRQLPHADTRTIKVQENPAKDGKNQHIHSESFVTVSKFSKMGQNLTHVDEREISKKHVERKFETQSNSIEFCNRHVLSEKTIKALNHREIFLQRSLNFQSEKPSTGVSSEHLLKRENQLDKQISQAHFNREIITESGFIRRNLGDSEKRESGSTFKAMPGPKIESLVLPAAGFYTEKQHQQPLAPFKEKSDISRPATEVARNVVENTFVAHKPLLSAKAKERVEFLSSLTFKVDSQKRLNLPISNLLTRISQTDKIKNADVAPRLAPGIKAAAKRIQSSVQPDKRNPTCEKVTQPQAKEFVVVRGQINQRRYIFGTEIALAAIIASAGIARVRQDRLIPQDFGNQNAPKANPALGAEQDVKRPEAGPLEIAEDSQTAMLTETIGRRIDDDIESFAVSSNVLLEVRSQEKRYLQNAQRFFKQILGDGDSRKTVNTQSLLSRPTILVELDDTLQKIAERYFNDINIAWLIADLNRGNVQESYIDARRIISMQSRQTLILPTWTDIVSFYESDFADVEIERLVTIIETSQVDVELYSRMFANVIENKSTRIKTNDKIANEAHTETENTD